MAKSLLKQSIKNSFYLNIGTVCSAVIALIFAGLRIRFLGVEAAGFLMLLETVTSMSRMFGGFGFGTAALRKIAVYSGTEKLSDAKKSLGAVLCVDGIMGCVIGAALIIAFVYIFEWSKTDIRYFSDAYVATVFTSLTFICGQLLSSYGIVFSALQRYDLLVLINTIFGILTGGVAIFTLTTFPTMTALSIVLFAFVLINLVVNFLIVRKLIGGMVLPRWNYSELRSMARFGGWAYFGSLSAMLVNGLDRIILTTFLGSQSLPYYVIGQRVITQVHTFLTGQSQFLFPMLAGEGERARDVVQRIQDRLRWFVAALASICYGGIAVLAYPMLTALVGPDFAKIAATPLFIACLQGFFASGNIVSYHVSWACGYGAPNAIMATVTGLLVAGSMAILIPHYGIIGASLGQLWIGITSLFWIYWVDRLNGMVSLWGILRPIVSPMTTILLVFSAAMISLPLYSGDRFFPLSLLLLALLLVAVFAGSLIEKRLFSRYMCFETVSKVVLMLFEKILVIWKGVAISFFLRNNRNT